MHISAMLAVLAIGASGCGWSVSSAREAYAQKWCSHYSQCNEIGSGKLFASTDECLTHQRSFALGLWPTADCDSKIDAKGIDVCLKAIEITQCNLVDPGLTLLKCTRENVCQ